MIAAIADMSKQFPRRRGPKLRKVAFWAFFVAAIAAFTFAAIVFSGCEIEREDCTQETKAFLAQTCLHLDHISRTCDDISIDCETELDETEAHCDLSVCLDTDETAACLDQLEHFTCETWRDIRCFETPKGMCDYRN